jgi:ATP-dependent DNA ligase
MDLPVMPPVAPMLARLSADIPVGAYSYEPKWDGFRSVVFRDSEAVEIGSRNGRPMDRYFPEVVAAVKAGLPERCVVDGEIVVPDPSRGRLDFEALQQRIHPAESRVKLLARRTPAHYVVFDLLALGDRDLTGAPFRERRRALEQALARTPSPIHLTPATRDPDVAARWFDEFEGAGLDGVIAKPLEGTYQPGRRVMFKVKHLRTTDCVVAGYRTYKGDSQAVGSLLLGLYDDGGELVNVGVVGAFSAARRRALFEELQPLVTTFEGHPWDWGASRGAGGPADEGEGRPSVRTPRSSEFSRWNVGKDLTFVALSPKRVVEVRYDHMEGDRFRHTAQFVRWRPDRDPRSCTVHQLEEPVSYDLADVLG